MKVTVVKYYDTDSYNSPPPRVVAVAKSTSAAMRWIKAEVDGEHEGSYNTYAKGHDAQWWFEYGTFRLEEVEVVE